MENSSHTEFAEALRKRVTGPGVTESALRQAVFNRAAGRGVVEEPYDELAAQIGTAAYRVTDDQVDAVRQRTGSDRAALEIILAAAAGAGMRRWDAAAHIIAEATDATS
ncbi:hypothetical protein CVV68_18130 [Arthrobacter livingstonensis]|uniref:Uncharacterized protein n=1 Tax=Arthrobacter livingstonensis TaxID=670078 RepID=A0A2V5L4K7_9MICC|nr:hypothetical protein [Arthrobacter livingstonensis]PYI65512.1 hypothetical protein CVV68_18130 [Arthrobacter livingstonensis]